MAEPVLSCHGVTAGYARDLPILHGVDLVAHVGTITTIIGPNGAGKSTLIKAIAGLVPVSSGAIRLGAREITSIRPDRLSAEGVAYVPQNDNIFRTLTIRENLGLALRKAGARRSEIFDRLMGQFPALKVKLDDKAGSLSGGQRQFLAVANALAVEPRLILMDEPSAGLSPKAAEEVLGMARALTDTGVTIVLVEQNVTQALRLSDHAWILAEGRNQIDGKAAELLGDPVVAEIYLGGKRLRAEA